MVEEALTDRFLQGPKTQGIGIQSGRAHKMFHATAVAQQKAYGSDC